jgi:hypothetical protein
MGTIGFVRYRSGGSVWEWKEKGEFSVWEWNGKKICGGGAITSAAREPPSLVLAS